MWIFYITFAAALHKDTPLPFLFFISRLKDRASFSYSFQQPEILSPFLHITVIASMLCVIAYRCICTYIHIKHALYCIMHVCLYIHKTSSLTHTICKIVCMFLIYFERPAWVTNIFIAESKRKLEINCLYKKLLVSLLV